MGLAENSKEINIVMFLWPQNGVKMQMYNIASWSTTKLDKKMLGVDVVYKVEDDTITWTS